MSTMQRAFGSVKLKKKSITELRMVIINTLNEKQEYMHSVALALHTLLNPKDSNLFDTADKIFKPIEKRASGGMFGYNGMYDTGFYSFSGMPASGRFNLSEFDVSDILHEVVHVGKLRKPRKCGFPKLGKTTKEIGFQWGSIDFEALSVGWDVPERESILELALSDDMSKVLFGFLDRYSFSKSEGGIFKKGDENTDHEGDFDEDDVDFNCCGDYDYDYSIFKEYGNKGA